MGMVKCTSQAQNYAMLMVEMQVPVVLNRVAETYFLSCIDTYHQRCL
jgi:hypothetical protein